jgi:hypothetical protein
MRQRDGCDPRIVSKLLAQTNREPSVNLIGGENFGFPPRPTPAKPLSANPVVSASTSLDKSADHCRIVPWCVAAAASAEALESGPSFEATALRP